MKLSAFTDQELMQFEEAHQRHMRAAWMALPKAVLTGLLVLCLLFSVIVEYALAYEIFHYLKAPLPGEDSSWSVGLFSMSGVLMALALHLYAHEHPDAGAVRLLKSCVNILVPLYALGAGLALAAVLYFDGADALFTAPAAATMELFSAAAESSGSPLLEKLIANFAFVFVLGCGGLGIVMLYIFHRLATLIRANVEELTRQAFITKAAREAMATIRTCDKEYAQLSREREAIAGQDPRASDFAFANTIAALIHKELAPTEKWLLSQQIRIKAPESRFILHEESGLDFKSVERRVAALRAIDAKTIAAAFHPETITRSKQ